LILDAFELDLFGDLKCQIARRTKRKLNDKRDAMARGDRFESDVMQGQGIPVDPFDAQFRQNGPKEYFVV